MRGVAWTSIVAVAALLAAGCTVTAAGQAPPPTSATQRLQDRIAAMSAEDAAKDAATEEHARQQREALARVQATTAAAALTAAQQPDQAQLNREHCAATREERQRKVYEYRAAVARGGPAVAATRRAYAKAHCHVVAKVETTGEMETYVDANGFVRAVPETVETDTWHCPKGAPEGIEGKPDFSDLQDRLPPQPSLFCAGVRDLDDVGVAPLAGASATTEVQ